MSPIMLANVRNKPGAVFLVILIFLVSLLLFFLLLTYNVAGAQVNTAPAQNADSYEWLEDVNGERALAWVTQQNAVTRAKLDANPDFQALRAGIRTALDSQDRIPAIQKMGRFVYNFWSDARHPRGLWRRTTLNDYRRTTPQWETVLDIDALADAEHENWVYKASICREPVFDRCLIRLSRGGADAVVVREFDLATKGFVDNGFSLPEAKVKIGWRDKDALYVSTDFGPGSLSAAGYSRFAKLWLRGTPLSRATTLMEGQQSDMEVTAYRTEHGGIRHDFIRRTPAFFTSENFLIRDDKTVRLDLPAQVEISFLDGQLLITLHEAWTANTAQGSTDYKTGSLLAIDFEAYLQGAREFKILFTPNAERALTSTTVTRHALLVQSLENVKSILTEWRFIKGSWRSRSVSLPTLGQVSISALDVAHTDDYLLTYSDYLTPSVLMQARAGSDARTVLKTSPAFFDTAGLETVQHFAISKDGTSIPYFIVKRKDLRYDGNNPCLLFGYGGFHISLTPTYSATIGKAWLEKGGVYVVANIRGGGEFGPRWHEAALKENRQRAYDDFFGVAEDLIAKKITSPAHLAAMGRSNGGLLAGVALTQRPDLFKAVVSWVPLLDMQRYHKLLAGASWMAEYGNPDLPEDWAYMQRYSPYQNVNAATRYPSVLFITSTRDDRVHPGHARKMAAKMMAQGHDNVWYYENLDGGHGGAANNAQSADVAAIIYRFLWLQVR